MTRTRRYLRAARFCAQIIGIAFALTLLLGGGGGGVRITSPRPGERLSGKVRVRAEARGLNNLAYLLFVVDSERPHATNSAPYNYPLDTSLLADGPHVLAVEAYGRFGLLAASVPITVTVDNSGRTGEHRPRAVVKSAPQAPATPAVGPAENIAQPKAGQTASPGTAAAQTVSAPAAIASAVAAAPVFPPSAIVPVSPSVSAKPALAADAGAAISLQPVFDGNRALVMFRQMAQGFGHRVFWLHREKTAVARKGDQVIQVTAAKDFAVICGKALPIGGAAVIKDSHLLVPVRGCAVAFAASPDWDAQAHVVVLRPIVSSATIVASTPSAK
jgi:hypothetical protein